VVLGSLYVALRAMLFVLGLRLYGETVLAGVLALLGVVMTFVTLRR
jgi:hypothetical protein